ncbi:hypothetical protein P67b_00076 [Ruegeria phage Tedan]|nr:hypothetical protein P67b_00076 [Ruegeria phage Tedan]
MAAEVILFLLSSGVPPNLQSRSAGVLQTHCKIPASHQLFPDDLEDPVSYVRVVEGQNNPRAPAGGDDLHALTHLLQLRLQPHSFAGLVGAISIPISHYSSPQLIIHRCPDRVAATSTLYPKT